MNQVLQQVPTQSPASTSTQGPRQFQPHHQRFEKPKREIKTRRRIVKDNQIWTHKDTKVSIKIIEQTRYYHRIAWFNVMELDEKGQYVYEDPDELNEDQILKWYRLQRSYDSRQGY